MHIQEGTIQAFIDGEIDEQSRKKMESHLAGVPGKQPGCTRCRELYEEIARRNQKITSQFEMLANETEEYPVRIASRQPIQQWLKPDTKEEANMFKRMFKPQYRTAWVVLAFIAIFALAMSFSPVRALANSFLSLFRVEQVAIVEINPETILAQMDGSGAGIETLLSEYVQFEGDEEPIHVNSAGAASSLVEFQVRLPPGMNQEASIEVIPGGRVNFTVDLAQISAVLEAIGRSDISLPQVLDGATVAVEVPKFVTTRWGDCSFASEAARGEGFDPDDPLSAPTPSCTALIQGPSPEVEGPPDIDLQQLGYIYLQLLGIDAQEAEMMAEKIDWASTFVLPIPQYKSSYQRVDVDGVEGTLIEDARGGSHGEYSTVIWVKDGIVYALSGPHNGTTIVRLANSLK